MLNIYYGRESVDKERFIFDKIRDRGYGQNEPVLLLVPDQYTLEAEKSAFHNLKTNSLMGLDVYSISRLSHRILKDSGADREVFIDKYGRQMLLTRIVKKLGEELLIFKGNTAGSSFVELANDFISQLKQYGIGPEELREAAAAVPEEELLRRKLEDISLIYEKYQEEIKGKYTDSEDRVDLVAEKLPGSFVRGTKVWVYGFDSIAPRTMVILREIMGAASEVNVVLTSDLGSGDEELFELSGILTGILIEKAEEAGCEMGDLKKIEPSEFPAEEKREGIRAIERNLFRRRREPCEDHSGITIVEAANIHNEAESAAAFALSLLRDEGYRLRDIVIICNDQNRRARALEMAFQEYGIPLFPDKKRGIESAGTSVFLTSLLRTVIKGYSTTDLMRALKTSLTDIDRDKVEKLDIYAQKYRVMWSMWKKPLEKGMTEYGEEALGELEDTRQQVMEMLRPLEDMVQRKCTVREFTAAFYSYITEELKLVEKLNAIMEEQAAMGEPELAMETEQVFGALVDILDQIVELMGDSDFEPEAFLELFSVGLSQTEVGILPTTADDMLMGTIQRTRTGRARAVILVGANEGVIPQETKDSGLLGGDELERLAEEGHQLGKLDNVRQKEEKLAIYRNLSKPVEKLWISYSTGDEEGKEIRRSSVVDDILALFPGLEPEKDLANQTDPMKLIGGTASTLRHLSHVLREPGKDGYENEVWKSAEKVLTEKHPVEMGKLEDCLSFRNEPEKLEKDLGSILFRGTEEYALSPSRLERYGHCPFAYFVDFGLFPEEIRQFRVDARDMGNAYHECIRLMAGRLDRENRWMDVTEEDCMAMAREAEEELSGMIREGIFVLGPEEKYMGERLIPACGKSMWALVNHVRCGKVSRKRHEIGFGRGRPIKPIEVRVGEDTFFIEGQIDRMDILENGRVKIIDYKSSEMDLKQEEARAGYRLQLMLYMKAAREGERKPAGVFYFSIKDPRLKGGSDEPGNDLLKEYKIKGIMVNDPETIAEIAGEDSRYSQVAVGVQKTKDGYKESDRLLTEEEFEQLQRDVDSKVEELCRGLAEGQIDIHPMRNGKETACDRCDYLGICRFDRDYPGCSYNEVM